MISLGSAMLVGAISVCVEAFFSGSEIAMVSASFMSCPEGLKTFTSSLRM